MLPPFVRAETADEKQHDTDDEEGDDKQDPGADRVRRQQQRQVERVVAVPTVRLLDQDLGTRHEEVVREIDDSGAVTRHRQGGGGDIGALKHEVNIREAIY